MADEVCPLGNGEGSGLPGYFGTMADMFTLLFAFFVLMFSMATMDPAKLSDAGGDDIGAAKEEEMKEVIEAIEKLNELAERCPIAPENIDVQRGIRHLIVGDYRVLYVIEDEVVSVLHIRHNRHERKI